MLRYNTIIIINILISGIIAFLITMFFAEGTIGENYTDKTFVTPEFFIILITWGIGAVLGIIADFKVSKKLLYISLIIMWLSIPVGYSIGMALAIN